MNGELRDMLERMRKFSECLVSIQEEKNREDWEGIISNCYAIKLKT